MLNIDKLADELNSAMGVTDKDGKPIATTDQMKTYAKAVINTLKMSLSQHLPGTVTGVTAAGAPLQNGAATGGKLLNVNAATWLGIMAAGNPTANPANLAIESAASTTYITGAALTNFSAGTITGLCTSTSTNPGPLANGAGQNGQISGLVGSSWATVVMPAGGDPALTQKIYKAISEYVMKEAKVTYAANTVQGTCPAVSGNLLLGLAAGGIVS